MHDGIEYAWGSRGTHKRQKYTCEWAWQDFARRTLPLSLSLSLQQHRGLQLSEVGDLWSFNTGKITFGSNVSFHRRESHTHVNRLHESGDRNAGNAIRFPATTIKNTSSCRSLKKGRNILSARSAPKRWRGLIRAETRPPSKFSGNPVQ